MDSSFKFETAIGVSVAGNGLGVDVGFFSKVGDGSAAKRVDVAAVLVEVCRVNGTVVVGTANIDFVNVADAAAVTDAETVGSVKVVLVPSVLLMTRVAVAVGTVVSVGSTRITGVFVGTGVGGSVGTISGVAVFVGTCDSMGDGRGSSQALIATATTEVTNSKQAILKKRLSLMKTPPLFVAV